MAMPPTSQLKGVNSSRGSSPFVDTTEENTTTNTSRKRRNLLSLSDKLELIKAREKGATIRELVSRFNLAKRTVQYLLKAKDTIQGETGRGDCFSTKEGDKDESLEQNIILPRREEAAAAFMHQIDSQRTHSMLALEEARIPAHIKNRGKCNQLSRGNEGERKASSRERPLLQASAKKLRLQRLQTREETDEEEVHTISNYYYNNMPDGDVRQNKNNKEIASFAAKTRAPSAAIAEMATDFPALTDILAAFDRVHEISIRCNANPDRLAGLLSLRDSVLESALEKRTFRS